MLQKESVVPVLGGRLGDQVIKDGVHAARFVPLERIIYIIRIDRSAFKMTIMLRKRFGFRIPGHLFTYF